MPGIHCFLFCLIKQALMCESRLSHRPFSQRFSVTLTLVLHLWFRKWLIARLVGICNLFSLICSQVKSERGCILPTVCLLQFLRVILNNNNF